MSSNPSGSLTVAVNTTDSPSVIAPTFVENERKKGAPSLDVVVLLLLVEATPDVSVVLMVNDVELAVVGAVVIDTSVSEDSVVAVSSPPQHESHTKLEIRSLPRMAKAWQKVNDQTSEKPSNTSGAPQ